MRRVGVGRLLKESLGKQTSWQEQLPVQAPRNVVVSNVPAGVSLIEYAQLIASYREGSHAVYLSPQSLKGTAFQSLVENYPPDAGLKLVKKPGGLDESGYILGRAKGDSKIQLGMVHGHRHLSLVANFLCASGIGPRLYDLVNLKCNKQLWTAYVIQDVGNNSPSDAQCKAGIKGLRELHGEGIIKVILPEGFDDPEFECPACGNNALVDGAGQFRYIDFQNFLLGDYESFLTRLASLTRVSNPFWRYRSAARWSLSLPVRTRCQASGETGCDEPHANVGSPIQRSKCECRRPRGFGCWVQHRNDMALSIRVEALAWCCRIGPRPHLIRNECCWLWAARVSQPPQAI